MKLPSKKKTVTKVHDDVTMAEVQVLQSLGDALGQKQMQVPNASTKDEDELFWGIDYLPNEAITTRKESNGQNASFEYFVPGNASQIPVTIYTSNSTFHSRSNSVSTWTLSSKFPG